MITETTESKISRIIEANIPTIEMHKFRSPPQFDGGEQSHYGFFNTETGNCLQSFTAKDGYELTTHDDYLSLATAAIDAMGGNGEVKAHWTESKSKAQATIIVQPSREQRLDLYDIGGNDSVFPRLIIEAPFGRTFKVRGGFYRDACRNLDIPRAIGKGFETTLRHTAQLRSRMSELIAVCQSSCDFRQMALKLNQLDQIEVKIADALAELYPMPENATSNAENRARSRAAAIYRRIHTESLKLDGSTRDDDKASAWRLCQAITGYVQHDKSRKNGIGEVDRAVMALHDTETNDIWNYVSTLLTA